MTKILGVRTEIAITAQSVNTLLGLFLGGSRNADSVQRVAKAAAKADEHDPKWTAEVDASIESMINGSVSFSKIASKLGNGLSTNDIKGRWYDH